VGAKFAIEIIFNVRQAAIKNGIETTYDFF
jgi:hypothetical protein